MTGIEYPEPRSRARFLADNALQPHQAPSRWQVIIRRLRAAMRGGRR
jgi:hypothetical protein